MPSTRHSIRSAAAGSIVMAQRAGMHAAIAAVALLSIGDGHASGVEVYGRLLRQSEEQSLLTPFEDNRPDIS